MTGGWSPFFNIKMGFCSAVTLAFATIFSLAAVALLAIAFSTDNWITIHVNLRGKDLQVESSLLKLLNSKVSGQDLGSIMSWSSFITKNHNCNVWSWPKAFF